LQEESKKLEEYKNKLYDMSVEKNKYIIEVNVKVNDSAIAYIDYLKDKIENFDSTSLGKAIDLLGVLND